MKEREIPEERNGDSRNGKGNTPAHEQSLPRPMLDS